MLDQLRILADAMSYLDRAYRRGPILPWVSATPEGAAYSIVRDAFIQCVEEKNAATAVPQAA